MTRTYTHEKSRRLEREREREREHERHRQNLRRRHKKGYVLPVWFDTFEAEEDGTKAAIGEPRED